MEIIDKKSQKKKFKIGKRTKTFVIAFAVLFVISGLVYALATITITGGSLRVSSLQKGIVGHWALDAESYNSNTARVTDKTPYENHGTNYGATFTTDQMGQSDRAMSFDGEDDFVRASGFSDLGTSNKPYSFAGWLKAASGETDGNIIHMSSGSGGSGWCLPPIALDGGKLRGYSWIGTPNSVYSTTTVTAGVWYHFVNTWDATNGLRIFVNGVLENSDPQPTYSASGASNYIHLGFGSEGCSGAKGYLNGSISDIRIYNHALSEDEIDTLYHSYRPKVAAGSLLKGLILDMPLTFKYTKDETVGSEILTDRTPYSNDGQNYGATVGSSYTDFDGVGDYVDCGSGNLDFERNNSYTLSAWYKGTDTGVAILSKMDAATSCRGYDIYIAGNYVKAHVINTWSSNAIGETGTLYQINDGVWHHIAVTYDGTSSFTGLKIYVDGKEESTTPSGSGLSNTIKNSVSFKIGSRSNGGGISQAVAGAISNVRIYNRALSESEIKLLFDKGR